MTEKVKSYFKDIYFESKIDKKNKKTIIILPGFPFPGVDKEDRDFLSSKGYNVFFVFYPGTYQSEGLFLENSPVKEISEFISYIKKGQITSLWDDSTKEFNSENLFLFGGSFSGPICLALSNHKDIDKIYLSSPVLDFNKHNIEGDEQELKNLTNFVKRAYKNIFRFDFDDISERMTQFEEFSQKGYLDKISKPILISHDPNDKTVSIKHAKNLIKLKPEIKLIEHSFGHSNGLLPKIWDRIGKFLN